MGRSDSLPVLIKITLITVTRLNGKTFKLNAIYIETIESFPDTTITLTNGKKYFVRETEEKVSELVSRFYQSVNLLGQRSEENDNEK